MVCTLVNDLNVIQDENNNKLYYSFKKAKNLTSNTKTVFILHGQGKNNQKISKFYDENWNIVCPLDLFGYDGAGSWFLGEHNDFFVKELMLKLIEHIKKETKSERIYFWGSSMGGYAAILFALLSNAEAAYANVPQIKLKNNKYINNNILMKNCINHISSDEHYPYWFDLVSLLENTPKYKHPVFFITQTRFHTDNYLNEHIYYFIKKCDELGSNYFLEIIPRSGHLMCKSIPESIHLFDKYEDDIVDWKFKNKQEYLRNKNKNYYIRVKKKDNFKGINVFLKIISDVNVGNKDLLISLKPECYSNEDLNKYNLFKSENDKIGVFRYIKTKVGTYSVSIPLDFPQSDYLEFSIKDFNYKGLSIIDEIRYEFY